MAKAQGQIDKQRMKAIHKAKLEQEKEKLKNGMKVELSQQKVMYNKFLFLVRIH